MALVGAVIRWAAVRCKLGDLCEVVRARQRGVIQEWWLCDRWGGSSGGSGRRLRSARSARASRSTRFPTILVLHSGPTAVSALAAAGRVVGAAVAVPLGPWVEFHRKRPVMVAMDVTRFAAVMSVPVAFALGWLSFAQLSFAAFSTECLSVWSPFAGVRA
jgi:hypothetical protein